MNHDQGNYDHRTTEAVQRYLNDLAGVDGNSPAEPIVRDLLAAAVNRLEMLCTAMLHRSYPRLTRPPLGLRADEMLSAVVERLLKAMRDVRPQTVRQFFALASQHMRWELNDLARRLDERAPAAELHDSEVAASVDASGPEVSATAQRILQAIESLPDEPREAFNLVRIQGMTQPEAAAILGVVPKTVKRRLDRARLLLVDQVSDLDPAKVARPDIGSPAE